MAYTEVFAGIAVADYGSARTWYERFFGRPPDLVPNDNEAAWQLTGGGWIYVVGETARAGGSLVTLLVDDIRERVAELEANGLSPGPIETLGGAALRAVVTDPDGNTIAVGQPTG